MLSLEDLADLGDRLRDAGFRIATQQYFDAERLLLQLAAAGALPPHRARLEPYLAPVFCTSAVEQQRFSEIYDRWSRRDEPQREVSRPSRPPLRKPLTPRRLALKLGTLGLLFIVALALWQHYRPRVIEGRVLSEEGKPVAGAEVRFGSVIPTKTGTSGEFRLRITASQLPAPLSVIGGGAKANPDVQLPGRVPAWVPTWLFRPYQYGIDWSSTIPVSVTLAPPPKTGTEPDGNPKNSTTPTGQGLGLQRVSELDAAAAIGPPTLWQRLDERNLGLVLFPLALFGVWALARLFRRPVLRRIASRTPAEVREVHFSGGVRTLLPGLPLRRLAQELRRRRLVDSNELQAEATIAATLRRAGIFTPVRGSRVEPEHLALVDRASLADHQGMLADQILADLARSDVLIERYDFDGDADQCRLREAFDTPASRTRNVPAWQRDALQTVSLAELRERHPDHRVLVFSDGAGAFDAFTGAPAPWLETLLEWTSPVLITPLPPDRWSRREWALEQLGVTVLPLSQSGLLALMSRLGGAPSLERGDSSVQHRGPALYDRSLERWLERRGPDAATLEALCSGLRSEFGERGFGWIAGCAAYPEIHWGITLRLGTALVPDQAELERLLPRVARLPWFREAFMPDWLRTALLARITVDDEDRTRAVIRAMLESVALKGGVGTPLRIALDAPPKRLWPRLRAWWLHIIARDRFGQMLNTAPPDSPMRDLVFLQFVSGERIGRLSLRAPAALLRTLFARQKRMVSKPLAAFVGSVALAVLAAWWWPPVDLGPAEAKTLSVRWDRNGVLNVLIYNEREDHDQPLRLASISWRQPDAKGVPAIEDISLRGIGKPGAGVVSADGRVVALVYEDGSVATLGSVGGYRRMSTTNGFSDSWEALAFDESGKLLAAAGKRMIAVWNAETGAQISRIDAVNPVRSLGFSPDARTIAVGSDDGAIRLWRLGDAVTLVQGGERQRRISALAFSADGRTLAAADVDGIVTLREVATGLSVGELHAKADIFQLAFQPKGDLLAAAESGAVWVWPIGSGNGTSVSTSGGDRISRFAFSPDGERLAVLEQDSRVALYSVPSASPAQSPALLVPNVLGRTLSDASDVLRRANLQPRVEEVVSDSPPGTIVKQSPAAGTQVQPNAVVELAAATARASTAPKVTGQSTAVLFGPDAQELSAGLRRYGFTTPTPRGEVQSSLEQLVSSTKPEDRVVIFLSGQGGVDRAGEYMLSLSQGRVLQSSPSVRAQDLLKTLAAIPAKEVLLVLHSDSAQELVSSKYTFPARTPGAVRLLLSSSDPAFPRALTKALLQDPPAMTARALLDATRRQIGSELSLVRLRRAGDSGTGEFTLVFPTGTQSRPAAPTGLRAQ